MVVLLAEDSEKVDLEQVVLVLVPLDREEPARQVIEGIDGRSGSFVVNCEAKGDAL